ncbi:hypothetical protein [Azohydromonas lata]|uniref:hypothetical protein n=1 Tax=Azohydromonas lata TaxID=45677 RepID=UPI00082CEB0D|nr:hypothetical protein [Azohydromonas lata]
MSKAFVDANYRFIAANQEVNARITQRQQALALYVSLVVSLLAVLVALRPTPGSREPPVEWLIFGFPVASLCLAFLNYMAERAISNLRSFLSVLEQLEDAHRQLPSYNTDPRWSRGANQARRFRDIATAILVLGGNAAGLGAALAMYPQRFGAAPGFLYLACALVVASVLGVLVTPKWSYAPPGAGTA